jgi:pSer/pThr/pTyr-binding forkhead associated (FHA) protein
MMHHELDPGIGYVLYASGPRFVVLRRIREGEALTIGRSRSADIFVDDPLVSRRHVVLRADSSGGNVSVRDIGSRNGTRLGGRLLEPNEELAIPFGEQIKLGRTTITVER